MPSDYYEILGCSRNASFEVIKRNYQNLTKRYHPDRQLVTDHGMFVQISEAWKTLKDEESRRKYDAILMDNEIKEQSLVYANLNLSDLEFKDGLCFYPCRCGNSYVIDKNLLDISTAIECDECSYVILIK